MGFVVKEFPLGGIIMFDRTELIIGHGESFRAGAEPEGFGGGLPDSDSPCPDDFSDIAGFGTAGFQRCSGDWFLGNSGRFDKQVFDGIGDEQ